ncbi:MULTISPECIES: DUF2946 family protein [Xanthomonas]|uniref:DUF2946 family protein n=1 Tax=Xanthomonas cucurbitae TaxID=56453 RepID=A0A2S7DRR9_9XANT|nr:DUF2946 family protein [Xanthomonas cucurbitae]PPU76523.1 hypothetical protein XcuCFBP2542_09815 [Xanthomonas cucurbitae]QHG88009.1 DUF2946 domain-containing protein [Xanthomonas cucurbitae]WDM66823.1 DUF2946 family protein [Xanthomonas cucurbitae]WDM70700.1 DUF2946 family protein [Xanthomonas cucurbitae]WDM74568.1 DUF2946 family protein [Xanthomonas cucurbitae]
MLRSFHRHRLLHLLVWLALLLLLAAPPISRWSQVPSQEPMCSSGPAGSIVAASFPGQAMPSPYAWHHTGHAAGIGQQPGDHAAARHGEACDYCTLAARLLPWLLLAVLCLLQLRPAPVATRVCTSCRTALRRAAHGARGPPLSA